MVNNITATKRVSVARIDVCCREGCSSVVANGIQCEQCQGWYHFKCTSLRRHQYEALIGSDSPFVCFSCLFASSSNTARPNSPVRTDDRLASVRIQDLENEGIKETTRALRNQVMEISSSISTFSRKLSELSEEIHSLNESVALSVPGPAAATEALKLSKEAVLESARHLTDVEIRRNRVILWGRFNKKSSPRAISHQILTSVLKSSTIPELKASWLTKKGTTTPKGILITLPVGITPSDVVDKRQSIQNLFKEISGVSRDKTLSERRKPSIQSTLQCSKLQQETKVILHDLKYLVQHSNIRSDSTVDIDSETSIHPAQSSRAQTYLPHIKRSPFGILGSAPRMFSQTPIQTEPRYHFRLGSNLSRPPDLQNTDDQLPAETQQTYPTLVSPNSTATPSVIVEEESVFKCYYTNCLSLCNKIPELRQLVKENNPSLLALTETWLTSDVLDGEILLPGYHVIRADSQRGRNGGIAIYLREDMPPSLLVPVTNISTFDQLWLQVDLRGTDKLLIGVIYRPPSISESTDSLFVQNVIDVLDRNPSTHLLLMGDFNLPSIQWNGLTNQNHGMGAELFDTMKFRSWTQHVKEPTRFRHGQTSSLLDLVFTNESHFIDAIHHLSPLGLSDHMLLKFDFLCYWTRKIVRNTLQRNFTRANFQDMRNYLAESTSSLPTEAENAYEELRRLLDSADKQFVPRTLVKIEDKHQLPRRIRRLLHQRSILFAKQLRTNATDDINNFKRIRNVCKSSIRAHQRQVQSRILTAAKTDNRVLYKFMQKQRKCRPSAMCLKRVDGSTTTDPQEISEIMKTCYEETFGNVGPESYPTIPEKDFHQALDNVILSIEEVRKELRAVKPYTAMGLDQVHPRILKEAAETIATPLHEIFSESLRSGVVPTYWRQASVCPIYKGGDRHMAVNYRPISLTSIPCKIMERLLKKRIMAHLESNKLISQHQFGFRPNHSCVSNLLRFMDNLTDAYDNGEITDAVFFDFAKAFDRVPHRPLLYKLYSYGIRGSLLKWIENFLTNRSFSVKIGDMHSSTAPVKSGVPQGSVLGPLLFLLYINDLPNALNSNVLLYADDLKIWNSRDANALQMDVDSVCRWAAVWGLPLNVNKCAHISFGGDSENAFHIPSSESLHTIASLPGKKDLGVWLSSDLSLSKHHEDVTKKAYATWHMILRSFPKIYPENFCFLFNTYVRPLLEYARQAVHSGLTKDTGLLERVQRRATKSVVGFRNIPYSDRLAYLNLYPLECRRLRGDLIFTFNLFKNGKIEDFFLLANTDHLRGHTKKLAKVRPRTRVRQNFFSLRVVSAWNSLPSEVIAAPSVVKFKSLLDIWLGLRTPVE
ncbi:MAG: reverse transcriptase domain-containing protein [Candidatus Thiodiazotropha sp.]